MIQKSLPIHLTNDRPKRVGSWGRGLFFASAGSLAIFGLLGVPLEKSGTFTLVGGLFLGLAMWSTKRMLVRENKIEIILAQDAVFFSSFLIKHPIIWSHFRDGQYFRFPWSEIASWSFVDSTTGAKTSDLDEYCLRIKSAPDRILTIDREPLVEIEEQFVPIVREVLEAQGGKFSGLGD